MINNKNETIKIPVLTQEEFNEFGRIKSTGDNLLENKFWKKVYTKRGLTYNPDEKLVNEFDELVSSGRMYLNLAKGTTQEELSNETKINIMKMLNERKASK